MKVAVYTVVEVDAKLDIVPPLTTMSPTSKLPVGSLDVNVSAIEASFVVEPDVTPVVVDAIVVVVVDAVVVVGAIVVVVVGAIVVVVVGATVVVVVVDDVVIISPTSSDEVITSSVDSYNSLD